MVIESKGGMFRSRTKTVEGEKVVETIFVGLYKGHAKKLKATWNHISSKPMVSNQIDKSLGMILSGRERKKK